MIIFGKFGDGLAERNRSVSVFLNNPMRIVTRVSPLRLLALTKEEAKERHPSRMSERLSRSALVAQSEVSTHGLIPVLLRGPRVASYEPRTPLSNRELDLLERPLSYCKQRKATASNREHSTVCDSTGIATANSLQVSESPSSAAVSDPNSRKLTAFLTGSGSQTEFVVTHSRQATDEFLTGARNAFKVVQFRAEFRTESQALREKECRSRDAAEQGKLPLHTRNEKELL
jgi:hypothetical protein